MCKVIVLACMLILGRTTMSQTVLTPTGEWPVAFELVKGQSVQVQGSNGPVTVKLLDYQARREADYWTHKSPGNSTLAGVTVSVEVDGKQYELQHLGYEMPAELPGLRLYVETTRDYTESAQIGAITDLKGDVRFSAVPQGRTWGPAALRFPIAGYRWRSSTYANTWSALVPFNVLYYHRGEDYGAIPDHLDLVAVADGKVTRSPLPAGDGKSNRLTLELPDGTEIDYAHMNIGSVNPAFPPGTAVHKGDILAKTGATWAGKPQQDNDSHVHTDLTISGMDRSIFPTWVEAYFRTYDDPVLALAGGFGFTTVGGTY